MLSWYGHVVRRGEERLTKRVWKAEGEGQEEVEDKEEENESGK